MATYYVSTSGNDNDSGTEIRPWKNIQNSVKKLTPGDTLLVNPGTYDKFDIIDGQCLSGTQINPITVKANGDVYIGRSGIATGIPEACIYLKDVSGWILDGFRIKDQRRAAFATHIFTSVEWIVVKNFIVENVWSANNATNQTTSTFRITATEGNGGSLNKLWVDNNTFINCSPRDIRGKGTEIVTLFGNIQNFLVENNRFTDCVSICIDILGSIYKGTNYGQPKNGIVRKNIVENNDLYRNGTVANAIGGTAAAGGTQETTNGYYNDRGGQNIVWENNVHWSPKTLSSFTTGWETSNESNALGNANHQIIRNNLSVSGFRGFQAGPGDTSVAAKFKNIRYAHNVGISTTYSGGAAFNARNITGTASLKNNIWEQKTTNGVIYNRQYDNAVDWDAAGNIIWCNSLNSGTLKWDSVALTPNNYNTTIESNTALNVDPAYVSEGNYNTLVYNDASWDYKLQNAAPGYNDSEILTTVTANGTNINILEVEDAYWFFAGIPMPNVTGDPILVNNQQVNIIAVDVDNNLITIDTPLTVSIGDPITYNAPILSRGLLDVVLTESGNIVTPDSCPGLILNGDFETANFTNWTTFTDGTVTFSSGGLAEIDITDPGSNTQLYQNNILINADKNYQLSFDAYTNIDTNNFTVALLQHNSPNANIGLNREVLVNTTPTTFTYNFTANLTETNVRLRFYFVASNPGIIYIDNVCLIENVEAGIIEPNFTFEPEIIYANQPVNFIDLSNTTNPILSWLWDFGDTNSDNIKNPIHTFSSQGVYNVELSVTTIDGTDSVILPITVLEAIVGIPPITGLYNINNIGTVSVQNNLISWSDLFNSNKNLLGVFLTSYNIFTGLGQSIDPYYNKILYFNIDTGNYRLEDSDGTILITGNDVRLSAYGNLHPVHVNYIAGNRGIGYWNWYQINQNILYGNAIVSWPTIFEEQYILANNL